MVQIQKETHVLIDEQGSPILKGSLDEMKEAEAVCLSVGLYSVSIEPITFMDLMLID